MSPIYDCILKQSRDAFLEQMLSYLKPYDPMGMDVYAITQSVLIVYIGK